MKKEVFTEEEKKQYEELKQMPVVFDPQIPDLKKYLGPKLYHSQAIFHKDEDLIGFAFGLGYNAYGGSVLSIEVIELPSYKAKEGEVLEIPTLENIVISEKSN